MKFTFSTTTKKEANNTLIHTNESKKPKTNQSTKMEDQRSRQDKIKIKK